MLHIFSLRAQFSQNVKYCYEICEALVPIFHSVKFAKCEIFCPTGRVGSHVVFAWIHCTDVRIHCTDILIECR